MQHAYPSAPRGHRFGDPQEWVEHLSQARRGFGGPRGPHGHGGFGPGGFGGPRGGFPGPWGQFGPGAGPRARRGDVRSAILGLLAEAPSNGYGLIKAIAEKTEGAWQPSPGSVYPTLAQLVDEGLIAQGEGTRAQYSLTDSGREYVGAHTAEIDAAFANATGGPRGGDELMKSVGKLMGIAGQFAMTATPDQRTRAAEKVDELRRELYRILGE